MLDVNDMTVKYGEKTIVDKVSFSVREGEWLMLVGPNGAGKSTIVSALSRGVSYSGSVNIMGRDIRSMKSNDAARFMGILSQNNFVGYPFTVEEVVSLGRYAYSRGVLSSKNDEDEYAVENALKLTGMDRLRGQSVMTLSGGELQRTFLSQVFAQNPKLLILDEPTNHLDLKYQEQIFELIDIWLKESGRAVLSVVHDLSLAKAYGTKALMLNRGKAVSYGNIDTVLSRENLKSAYEMDVYGWMSAMLSQWG